MLLPSIIKHETVSNVPTMGQLVPYIMNMSRDLVILLKPGKLQTKELMRYNYH